MDLFMRTCLAIVLGCLSAANAQTPFCSGDLCFMRPDDSSKTWTEAQQRCKENNLTLPIIDYRSRQTSLVDALSHFQLNNMDVWLGATASDYVSNNWRWLDGSQYTGSDVQQQGEYYKSYAYIAKRSTEVLAYPSPHIDGYSYICQNNVTTPDVCTNDTGRTAFVNQNRCYMRYEEKSTWFSARNKCLENKSDLASFTQLSILDRLVDSSGFWVGLRHSQWNWQNAVTGLSSDVTYTSWSSRQPDDTTATCISINSGDFPNWKDWDCTRKSQYICQVVPTPETSSRSPASSSSTTPTATSSATSPTRSSTSNHGLSEPEKFSTTRLNVITTQENKNLTSIEHDAGSVNVPLAVGLGVGLGVPVVILIVVVIVVVALRKKNRNGIEGGNSQYRKQFAMNSSQENTNKDKIEMSETINGRTRLDNSTAQYATIKSLNPDAQLVPPSDQGIVYADLQFGGGNS